MKKILSLLITLVLLNGCAESVALLGTSVGGASNVDTNVHRNYCLFCSQRFIDCSRVIVIVIFYSSWSCRVSLFTFCNYSVCISKVINVNSFELKLGSIRNITIQLNQFIKVKTNEVLKCVIPLSKRM